MKRKYKASILSWFWLILQPSLMVFMYWFSFSTSGNMEDSVNYFGTDYNYLQWLIIGVLTWSYCGDILLSGPSSLSQYRWISKSFGISPVIPPVFVNLAKFMVGGSMIMVSFVISMIFNGVEGNEVVTLHALELPVMLLLMFCFMTAWSYFLSSLVAISRDMQNLIAIIPLLLGWISGVFIKPVGVGESVDEVTNVTNIILQINPFNFMVNGIRSTTMGFGSPFVPNDYNQWYSILSFFLFMVFFFSVGYIINKITRKFLLDII
ncbi:MAG: ABC transporter permease [Mycoplasma sp.]